MSKRLHEVEQAGFSSRKSSDRETSYTTAMSAEVAVHTKSEETLLSTAHSILDVEMAGAANPYFFYRGNDIVKLWERYLKALNPEPETGIRFYIDQASRTVESIFNGMAQLQERAIVINRNDGSLYKNSNGKTITLCGEVDYTHRGINGVNKIQDAVEQILLYNTNHDTKIINHLIVFPYHATPSHWNLGQIKLWFDGRGQLTKATIAIYEPYGGAATNRNDLVAAINELGFLDEVLMTQQPINQPKQQNDGSSCGVITAENGKEFLKREIDGENLLERTYEKGAIKLRERHIIEISQEAFTAAQHDDIAYDAKGDKPLENLEAVTKILSGCIARPENDWIKDIISRIKSTDNDNERRECLDLFKMFLIQLDLSQMSLSQSNDKLSDLILKSNGEFKDGAMDLINGLVVLPKGHDFDEKTGLMEDVLTGEEIEKVGTAKDAEGYKQLAFCLIEAGKRHEALMCVDQGVARLPDSDKRWLYAEVAEILRESDSGIAEAIECYKKSIYFGNSYALRDLGRVLHDLGRYKEAFSAFVKLDKLMAENYTDIDYENYVSIARTLYRMQEYSKAKYVAKKILKETEDFKEEYVDEEGDHVLRTAQALQYKKFRAQAYNTLGNIFQDQGELDTAMEQYDKAIVDCNRFILPYIYKAEIFNQNGKYKEALNCYEKANDIAKGGSAKWYDLSEGASKLVRGINKQLRELLPKVKDLAAKLESIGELESKTKDEVIRVQKLLSEFIVEQVTTDILAFTKFKVVMEAIVGTIGRLSGELEAVKTHLAVERATSMVVIDEAAASRRDTEKLREELGKLKAKTDTEVKELYEMGASLVASTVSLQVAGAGNQEEVRLIVEVLRKQEAITQTFKETLDADVSKATKMEEVRTNEKLTKYYISFATTFSQAFTACFSMADGRITIKDFSISQAIDLIPIPVIKEAVGATVAAINLAYKVKKKAEIKKLASLSTDVPEMTNIIKDTAIELALIWKTEIESATDDRWLLGKAIASVKDKFMTNYHPAPEQRLGVSHATKLIAKCMLGMIEGHSFSNPELLRKSLIDGVDKPSTLGVKVSKAVDSARKDGTCLGDGAGTVAAVALARFCRMC